MITLTTKSPCPIVTVTLPNPVLGDNDQVNIKTKFKTAMDGTVYSYLNTPAITKFLLTFTNVSTALVTQLKEVIDNGAITGSLGSYTYVDYDGVSHTVQIVNNPLEITSEGRAPCNNWNEVHSFTLELEKI